jgi:hypothetical protein
MGFPIKDTATSKGFGVNWSDADGNPADLTGCSVAFAVSNPAHGEAVADPTNPLTRGVFNLSPGATPLGDGQVSATLTKPDGTSIAAVGDYTIVADVAVAGGVVFDPEPTPPTP